MVGEYAVVPRATVHSLARHTLRPSDPHYLELRAKHFLRDADSDVAVDLLTPKNADSKTTVGGLYGTPHICRVVTL